jgi:hypothetical protein
MNISIGKMQPRLLLFYGGTLAFVLLLFQVVTRYGDTKLVASPNIDGRYLSTETMPGCPPSSRVLLTILQSGIYLNGAVNVVENEGAIDQITSEQTPPLSGQLVQQEVTLSGGARLCQAAQSVRVAGKVVAAGQVAFTGTLQDGNGQPWQMKALRLAKLKKESGH